MSQWTHVAGIIRIDALSFLSSNIEGKIKDAFGNTVEFSDSSEKWAQCNVPCGSEGSVQYSVVRTGIENHLSWGLVYIWGDLRDYDSVEEIQEWLNNAIEKINAHSYAIRQCVVNVEIEGAVNYVLFVDNDSIEIGEPQKILVHEIVPPKKNEERE